MFRHVNAKMLPWALRLVTLGLDGRQACLNVMNYVLRTFTSRSAHRNKVLLSNCQLSRRLSYVRTVSVVLIHLTTVVLRIPNAIQSTVGREIQGFFLYTMLKQSQCRTFPCWKLKEHQSELVQCFALALDLQSRRRDF